MARIGGNWISGHHLERRGVELAGLMAFVAVLEIAAAVGMSYVAGFSEVHATLNKVFWPWLAAMTGALLVSFVGYYFAYGGAYLVNGGPRISTREMVAVVTAGFGGFLAHGGSALDNYALRAAGAQERDAAVRVSALAGMEHGVLAVFGTAAGIAILVQGRTAPPGDFSIPWAVIPLPGFALAFWLAGRYRERMRRKKGWRGKVGVFLDSIYINRVLFLHPREHAGALLGMSAFWLSDAFAMWAAMAAFGYAMNAAALFIGYATGMVFTRRTGPFAGAGVLMVVLPVTIWYSGAPMAVAVVGVFAYRVLALWLPMPFALAALPTLRDMGSAPRAASQEPALQPEAGG